MKTFTLLFLDHFKDTAKLFFDPLDKFFTFIGSIRPNSFHRLHDGKQRLQYSFRRMTVINIGRMDDNNEGVTYCINYNMPLSTLYSFPPIEPRFLG